ncbi:signal peptidase I [Rhizomicrobium electricum]|uniref:Signal peptidase I n=2 Tax=Rhizomicrobium electricum TaxID=480070 RepID=A0ABN1E2U6_9PROT|nr:signal peptidase I [Rhizomicrobium electricum]NIJ47508.1 signal peptidase I [Rhizomicrobium electricum]
MTEAIDATTPDAASPAVTRLAMVDAPSSDVPPPVAETPPAASETSDSWWDLVRILIYALLIALFERTLFFQPYNIPSGSMEDTLLVGDFLFVEKFSYGYSRYSLPWGRFLPGFGRVWAHAPQRGDVAVFALPTDPQRDFIKRIVGLPGDRVQMLHGVLYLNDRPVPKVRVADYVEDDHGYHHRVARYRETMPNGKSYYVLDREIDGLNDNTPVYTVPVGHYFMMGDNRDDSDDSRGVVGYLPAENLVGRAEFKFLSIDERKTHFFTFWKWPSAIRWDRFFSRVD